MFIRISCYKVLLLKYKFEFNLNQVNFHKFSNFAKYFNDNLALHYFKILNP